MRGARAAEVTARAALAAGGDAATAGTGTEEAGVAKGE